MMKMARGFIVGLMLVFCVAMNGQANYSMTDVNTNDANRITFMEGNFGHIWVNEDYNETHLVPYPSHDGYAIVNAQGGYFDKVIQRQQSDTYYLQITMNITNTTPYRWSDYHFELWTADFSRRLNYGEVFGIAGASSTFGNSDYFFNGINYYAPNWVNSGDTTNFNLWIQSPLTEYGLRQIATTAVPIPGAILLFAPGLAGLAAIRRRFTR
jgi:hypothetical protein